MTGREFKRLVATKIPDDAIVEMSVTEKSPYPDDDEEITAWYKIKDIEVSNESPKIWLIKSGEVTRW